MVAIVDYGGGNCASVARALERLGEPAVRSFDPAVLTAAARLVLPGVGHFGTMMERLEQAGVAALLRRQAAAGVPLLGICLGMQALYEGSEEAPGVAGLGLLPGRVRRLAAAPGWRVPHVGWSAVQPVGTPRLLAGAGAAQFYFTHSYHAPVDAATVAAAQAATTFAAAVERGNVSGVQFHPEKSGAAGLRVLRNFIMPPPAPAARPPLRIIACLDLAAGRVVKGVRFVNLRDCGDPAELAAAHAAAGADEVFLLDIAATVETRQPQLESVRRVAREIAVPLGVGGGVRSVADASALLLAGADKVSVNSAALARPALIGELAAAFGSQAVVVAVDARREGSGWRVMARAGRDDAGREAAAWAREASDRGAGEILLTSMDCDGGQQGFDCALTAEVASAVPIPVIASGGAGECAHFLEVFTRGGASAALAASIFHQGSLPLARLKLSLAEAGLAVRLPETAA